ncbi:unnamed protein product [Chondrus crispus]|uniref:Uncharacterized protein n=1 Tax=Chondrus crispus TaxID=2769 RepID=R7QFS7_CHOCR|nr:unnamed protein product [Chondrus crispus]CDF36275.1 unnamed protein product [Chondrus crispus]|eukprot:XP_005716094.1 unnamed protein product [Chondrus crispus]
MSGDNTRALHYRPARCNKSRRPPLSPNQSQGRFTSCSFSLRRRLYARNSEASLVAVTLYSQDVWENVALFRIFHASQVSPWCPSHGVTCSRPPTDLCRTCPIGTYPWVARNTILAERNRGLTIRIGRSVLLACCRRDDLQLILRVAKSKERDTAIDYEATHAGPSIISIPAIVVSRQKMLRTSFESDDHEYFAAEAWVTLFERTRSFLFSFRRLHEAVASSHWQEVR